MKIAELKNVCKTYPAFKLNNVSFSLESGKITGFIGRNGAGKTTVIKSMLNLVHTDSGEICYFGKPLSGNETDPGKPVPFPDFARQLPKAHSYPPAAFRELLLPVRR